MPRRSRGLVGRSRAHLAAAGESYVQHFRFALTVGTNMVLAGGACLVHALVPALCEDTASRAVRRLQQALDDRPRALALLREGEAAGLLTLIILSLATAALPWLLEAPLAPSLSLSLIALAFPVAALRDPGLGQDEPGDEPGQVLLRHDRGRQRVPATPSAPFAEIVIVGGGFSGTALALQLARRRGPRVTLVERRGEYARGAAYSARSPSHLLNVPAARMSAFADQPDSFRLWLAERGLGEAHDFAPRCLYGEYLEDQLVDALAAAAGCLRLTAGDAVDVERAGGRSQVVLADGRRLPANAVVLALGNLPPASPAWLPDDAPAALLAGDPWAPRIAAGLTRGSTLLMLGTGLTMIDAVLTLGDAGFEGRMVAISRRGLLPRAHADVPHGAVAPRPLPDGPVSQRLRAFRRRAMVVGWHAAMDELRPVTQDLWQAAPQEARDRFLRHLRPWWDVHRHRAAPAIARRITRLRETGHLQIHAGRIESCEPHGDRARIGWRPRGDKAARSLEVDRIVNCTGPNAIAAAAGDPLLRRLLEQGLARPGDQDLGLDVDETCRLVGVDGRPSDGLFAIGPLTRGRFWEVTAVPDIRVKAAALAEHIATHVRVA